MLFAAKIAICARDHTHIIFELCMPNYVGAQLQVFTIKIYMYIIYIILYITYNNIYNIDYIDTIYVVYI